MKWNSEFYDKSHDFVSKHGKGVFEYLKPEKHETILDLGCGTGDLTFEIFKCCRKVIGIDSSEEMIAAARSKFPEIEFERMDAQHLEYKNVFDAIFSNAVLHWVADQKTAIRGMYEALRPGGRIILEFGGKGNNEQMLGSLRRSFNNRGLYDNANIDFWYYPSIGEYSSQLEMHNFRVVHAEHFDRFTELKGNQGIKDWFQMFGEKFFSGISAPLRDEILDDVQDDLTETHNVNGKWHADYKRIRVVAVKE